jgi:phytoene dehydrogenase-like protein
MADAVVIGSGPNGLVAANLLADAGWDVLVLEAEPEPGGAVRSGELTLPGYRHDRFSAFYPLAVASPVMRALELERWGVRWRRHPVTAADPAEDGTVALLSGSLDETCASLDGFAAGDGDAFARWYAWWSRLADRLMDALMTPFPPVRAGARLAAALGPRGLLDFARLGVLPVRRFAEEEFRGDGAARLFAGNALHADFSPELPGSALFGCVLVGMGQQVGYPTPEGGAGELTAALVRRLQAGGGRLECSERAERIVVRGGRAVAVRTAAGLEVRARRAVLADVGAPQLYCSLLASGDVPARVRAALRRFEYDAGTVKVDWALSGAVPWAAEATRRAGTVHITRGLDALTEGAAELARGLVPRRPNLVCGQHALADPTRQPPGHETFWAYGHVPQRVRGDGGDDGLRGAWDAREAEAIAARFEAEIEALAPGFRELVRARHIATPPDLERANANLVGGAMGGGTAQLHQQLVFRPVPGLGRPETPIAGLYLASASAHPGGGVHGACGANAARAARRVGRLGRARNGGH